MRAVEYLEKLMRQGQEHVTSDLWEVLAEQGALSDAALEAIRTLDQTWMPTIERELLRTQVLVADCLRAIAELKHALDQRAEGADSDGPHGQRAVGSQQRDEDGPPDAG